MNNEIIVYFCFLIAIYAFFVLNPFSILDYFFTIFTFLSIIFIFYYTLILQKNNVDIGKIIRYFCYALILFITFFIIFLILKSLTLYYSKISFTSILLLYIVIFSIIYVLFKDKLITKVEKIEHLKDVIIYLLFFIPCLLIDFIKFISKDIQETHKNTFILFIGLLFIILMYIIYPYFSSLFSEKNIKLIKNKHSLNKSIITYNLEELQTLIEENRYFWQSSLEPYNSLSSAETEEFLYHINKTFDNIHKFALKQMIVTNDNLKELVYEYKDSPDKLEYKIQERINQSFYLKLQYYLDKLKQTLFLRDETSINIKNKLYTYHYGISFWLYLDTNMLNHKENESSLIMSIGSRPSLYFDHLKKELYIEIYDYIDEEKKVKQKRIYQTKNILYQKWNHVVMNYVNGQFDLFINNKLVHSEANVSPYISKSETLQVGSIDNPDIGGISNMNYYEQPLQLSKINSLYSKHNID